MDNHHEDLKAELTCPICMDLFREPRRLPCGHVYCRVCLQDMLTRKYLNARSSERILSCPECRQRYDLTFQQAGVDVFPRDFKLVRLVELCEKKFTEEGGGVDRGAEAGTDDETAVKQVYTAESEGSTQTTSTLTTTSSSSPSSSTVTSATTVTHTTEPTAASSSFRHPLPWQHIETASLHSFNSPSNSLSDDSWIYVSPEAGHAAARRRVIPPNQNTQWRERGDDSWLLPSAEDQHFPRDGSSDVRGSPVIDYHTIPPSSGSYDNNSRENFHRFAAAIQPVPCSLQPSCIPRSHRPRPPTSPSSESSSGSESSDERGDEGSGEYDVSRSGSEEEDGGGNNATNRRSRLSRFFRSLVMSDSDSWDEEDMAGGPNLDPGLTGQQVHFEGGHRDQQLPHHVSSERAVARMRMSEERVIGELMPQEALRFENASLEAQAPSASAEGHLRLVTEGERGDPSMFCNTNHSSMGAGRAIRRHPADVVADDAVVEGGAEGGARGGGAGREGVSRVVMGGRGRVAIETCDDSGDEYEPQTSMLRPRRKPRSRLKKFFTSLLSLSSSDEEDDVEEVESQVASSTSASDMH